MLTSLWRKWRASGHGGPALDVILAGADPDAPLAQRNLWMVDPVSYTHLTLPTTPYV